MRASDSFLISSRSSLAFSMAAVFVLVFASMAAVSASYFCRISWKICSFCLCVILDGTCRVADESGVEEGWGFLRDIAVTVQETEGH